jgi:hypothetical protein
VAGVIARYQYLVRQVPFFDGGSRDHFALRLQPVVLPALQTDMTAIAIGVVFAAMAIAAHEAHCTCDWRCSRCSSCPRRVLLLRCEVPQ